MLCVHCGKRKLARPRGLCNRCFADMGIRSLYPLVKPGHKGLTFRRPKLPAEPTKAMPGTEEKMDVMAKRAAAGEQLWHPLDPTI